MLITIPVFLFHTERYTNPGSPDGSVVKKLHVNEGGAGSIPGSGRSPGEGNGKPLQSSCLGNPMDREAWWATVHGITKTVGHDLPTINRQILAN